MRDPVRASDGHVYERLAITRWFAQRLTSPMTGAALADGALEPQDALRERIYDWAVARRGSPASRRRVRRTARRHVFRWTPSSGTTW